MPRPANDALRSSSAPLVILGVDPGLRVTGWGIVGVQDGALFSPACGAIPTQAKRTTEERLYQIFKELCEVIARWRPAEAAVEDPFGGGNVRTAFAAGEARAWSLAASSFTCST